MARQCSAYIPLFRGRKSLHSITLLYSTYLIKALSECAGNVCGQKGARNTLVGAVNGACAWFPLEQYGAI